MSDKRRINYMDALESEFATLKTPPQNDGVGNVEKETDKTLNRNTSPVLNQVKKQPDNKEYEEPKSRRFQMLMQPTLFAEIQREAKRQKTSVNDLIHTILKDHLNNR